jgi:methylmalonyl-CoA mutase
MTDLSIAKKLLPYKPKHKVRFVTAASLFDGHDASINIMRRILQSTGAEVIHLGHNRSVQEIVNAALQEDVQGIAITSYQGGHVEFFKYMIDLLKAGGGENIKVFGGGGGVIVPSEIDELHAYGVTRVYSPQDGQSMGLQGMINEVVAKCDFDLSTLAPQDADEVLAALKGGRPPPAGADHHGARERGLSGSTAQEDRARGEPGSRCRRWASPAPAVPASRR